MLIRIALMLWKNRNMIAYGLITIAAVIAGWYVMNLRDTVIEQEQQIATLRQVDKENKKALENLKEQHAKDLAAVVQERDQLVERLNRANDIKREIYNAPPTDNGPVAPVLRRTLDRLREHRVGASGQGGKGSRP